MLNQDKYRTAEERVEAYLRHKGLDHGTMGHALAVDYFGWLDLEAEDEKPEPCFYCGGEIRVVDAYKENEPRLACGNCAYVSCAKPTKEEAIAAHNRVARAVRAAKGEGGIVWLTQPTRPLQRS